MASVPPASTRSARPVAISSAAVSIACMPDAQLRCTVKAGVVLPQPSLMATIRAILASSMLGAAQPRMTSSNKVASKGCRVSRIFPQATARSLAEKGPGTPFAFRNGVRAPSMILTARPLRLPVSLAKTPTHFYSVRHIES